MTTAKMLQAAPPFQLEAPSRSDRLFRWMEEIGESVHYGRGEWIHSGHDAPDAIYLIRRGRVGLSVGEEGAILRAGELFGELFFNEEEFRGSYLARALDESEVLVVRRERVQELLGERGVCVVRGLIAYKRDLVFLFSQRAGC
ncbi:MAG: cyclic nucleotide-binding domain-containing protein [Candidatus Bipolaricaulota bacterium]|nr:cyclic nucleotide-binding domain-containing protein [Candidatus Bipolaricaulota bacterium]